MRRKLGFALGFVGAFLVVVAILCQTYASGSLKKTPIDSNTVTSLEGTAETGGDTGEEFPVKVTSTTKSDSAKSDGDVAVFVTSQCVVRADGDEVPDCVSSDDPENRLISASTDSFATDRKTGLAVNDPEYLPADAVPHEGLVNKWPFDAEKKTYDYWNGTVGSQVDATYDRTEDLDGLETYVYLTVVEDIPVEIAEGLNGTFNSTTEIFVDPVTGSIVNQVGTQERVDDSGNLVLSIDAAFTDDEVAEKVEEAKDNGSKLALITTTVPLIGYIVGIPALLVGIALLLLGRNRAGTRRAQTEPAHNPTPTAGVS